MRAVTITQVETSTGVLAPVGKLTRVVHEAGALVIVDAVCAFAGLPTAMDELGLDVVLTGAQKALGVPPGLAILLLSPAAMKRRQERERVPAYYADLANWETSMANPEVYFSTHAVNLFYALERALGLVAQEGLIERFARHERLAAAFRAGMSALGFSSLTEEAYLAPTLSVLGYPDGIDDTAFRAAMSQHGVVVAGCLGDFKGRGARFGHMGNIGEAEILRALAAVEHSLQEVGQQSRTGVALAAAGRHLTT
ncbi:MAG: pyridoxal-phosphate-dependent aminotransferase family protein [Chloroflexota bacterium]